MKRVIEIHNHGVTINWSFSSLSVPLKELPAIVNSAHNNHTENNDALRESHIAITSRSENVNPCSIGSVRTPPICNYNLYSIWHQSLYIVFCNFQYYFIILVVCRFAARRHFAELHRHRLTFHWILLYRGNYWNSMISHDFKLFQGSFSRIRGVLRGGMMSGGIPLCGLDRKVANR